MTVQDFLKYFCSSNNIDGAKKHCMKVMLSDNLKAREMMPDGTYRKKESGGEPSDAQAVFMREALNARRPAAEKRGKEGLLHRVLGLFRRQQ